MGLNKYQRETIELFILFLLMLAIGVTIYLKSK